MVWRVFPHPLPVLVKSEVEVYNISNKIIITKHNYYENSEDNTRSNLGTIYYDSINELEQIINELAKIGETP